MHQLVESGAQAIRGPTAESTIPIEEVAHHLREEENSGHTATGTMRTTDLLAMTVMSDVKAEAEASIEIGRHTMEGLRAEK